MLLILSVTSMPLQWCGWSIVQCNLINFQCSLNTGWFYCVNNVVSARPLSNRLSTDSVCSCSHSPCKSQEKQVTFKLIIMSTFSRKGKDAHAIPNQPLYNSYRRTINRQTRFRGLWINSSVFNYSSSGRSRCILCINSVCVYKWMRLKWTWVQLVTEHSDHPAHALTGVCVCVCWQ